MIEATRRSLDVDVRRPRRDRVGARRSRLRHWEPVKERLWLGLAAVTAVGGGVAVAAGPAAVQAPPPQRVHRHLSDIYVVDLVRRTSRKVTHAANDVFYEWPAWSQTGDELAFQGPACDECPATIYLVGADGTGFRKIRTGVRPTYRPSWSPDGNRLMFVGGPDSAVYTVGADGSHPRRLTHDGVAHDRAVWSPRAGRIAYTVQQPNGRWDIWIMHADGTHARPVTRTPGSESEPSWSPDGRRLAFTKEEPGRLAIWVVRTNGKDARRVSRGRFDDRTPAWSPTGDRIAFTRSVSRPTDRDVTYLMRPDGRVVGPVPIAVYRSSTPTWSPDGKRLAVASMAP